MFISAVNACTHTDISSVSIGRQLQLASVTCCNGLTENARHKNDGPSKLQDMKLQDMKLTDQFSRHLQGMEFQDVKMKDQYAGHEIAGHENDGPNRPM